MDRSISVLFTPGKSCPFRRSTISFFVNSRGILCICWRSTIVPKILGSNPFWNIILISSANSSSASYCRMPRRTRVMRNDNVDAGDPHIWHSCHVPADCVYWLSCVSFAEPKEKPAVRREASGAPRKRRNIAVFDSLIDRNIGGLRSIC